MEVFNLSIDNNEEDTSGDDCDDEDHESLFRTFIMPSTSTTIFTTSTSFQKQFSSWERSREGLDTLFYSSSTLQEQPEAFTFFLLDTKSSVTKIFHPGIQLDPSIDGLSLHNVMRLFGVTTRPPINNNIDDESVDEQVEENHDKTTIDSISVCCNVHGFLPYCYLLPDIVATDDKEINEDEDEYWTREKDAFQSWLNEKIKTLILQDVSYLEYYDFVAETGKIIARIEIVHAGNDDSGIYGYYESKKRPGSQSTFLLKVFCTLPKFIWKIGSTMSKAHYKNWKFQCFEANLNNTMRFLTDRNITGCSWFELNANKYFVRSNPDVGGGGPPAMESHCQVEVDVHYKDIIQLVEDCSNDPPNSAESKKSNPPPVRVLSFDIEVMTTADDLTAPLDGRRQVIQIGAVLGNYYAGGNAKDSIIGKVVFVLGTCDGIPDTKVIQFYVQERPEHTNEKYMEDAEASLLGAWRDFIIQMDPDIISGYNIKKFDVPYLLDRSSVLDGFNHKAASILPFLGRLQKIKSRIRIVQNEVKKVYEYDEKNINIQGRLILDLYPIILRHDKLNHGKGYYKLSSVAKRYLHKTEEKQDVAYTEIQSLQHGSSTTRNRMARYCLQDSMIPYLLLYEPVPCRREKITYLDLYFAKSRVAGPPLRYLLNKSLSYSEYFKQVRIQKNPETATYVPDTPSPRKPIRCIYDPEGTEQKDVNNIESSTTIARNPKRKIIFGNSNISNSENVKL